MTHCKVHLNKEKIMAINKNHEFEELDGSKCSIVEKNASQARVDFLNDLLQFNNYTVVIVDSPPAKVIAVAAATPVSAEIIEEPIQPIAPSTFTVGVTDVSFNPTNAIFGRLLKTKDRRVVTLAYWQQKEAISNDDIPYFDKKL